MQPEALIIYANALKKKFYGKTVVEIAKDLSYSVLFLNTSPKFLIANTYCYKNGKRIIIINSNFDEESRNVLCAHELGHAILNHPYKSTYKDANSENEYAANLFAVALLFNEKDFNMRFKDMPNYILQTILDANIENIN